MDNMNLDISVMNEIAINGYTEYSGIVLEKLAEGYAQGRIDITDHHRNPYGAVHGGVIFCLGDVIGGIACRTYGDLPVTLSSNATYFKPMLHDNVIYAQAHVVKHGKTTSFVEVNILNEEKTEAVRIAATYYNLEGRI